jgi:GGDEF domain-containing protein
MFKNHSPASSTRLTLLLAACACIQPLLLGISPVAFGNAALFGVAAAYSYIASTMARRQVAEWKSRLEQRFQESLQQRRSTSDNEFSVTYFMVRLEQEVRRSRRYKLPLSVLVLQLAAKASEESALAAVVTGGARLLRAEDTFAFFGVGEFAFFLPHTDSKGARIVASRLVSALERFAPSAGVASLEQHDGAGAKDLLTAARRDVTRVETAKAWNEDAAVA